MIDACLVVVVLASLLTLGYNVDYVPLGTPQNELVSLWVAEAVFFGFFCLDLLFRFKAHGFYIFDNQKLMTVMLICHGVDLFVLSWLVSPDNLSFSRSVRQFRMYSLLRVSKMFPYISDLT